MTRSRLFALALIASLAAVPALAASTDSQSGDQPGKHDTVKGAAAGALVGHEVGHGHALAGAAAGAAIGHHEKTKAEKNTNG